LFLRLGFQKNEKGEGGWGGGERLEIEEKTSSPLPDGLCPTGSLKFPGGKSQRNKLGEKIYTFGEWIGGGGKKKKLYFFLAVNGGGGLAGPLPLHKGGE